MNQPLSYGRRMTLEKILIINDDIEDILAIQSRLPKNIEITTASQWQAGLLRDISKYDLVIIDNDANNLKKSKGKEILQKIRSNNSSVPVLYTSFQPGWVDGSVFQTRNVEVVRTDQVIDRIGNRFGLELKNSIDISNPEPELNLILTYNPVKGYNPGIFSDGKLLVVSYDRHSQIRAREVLAEQIRQIYTSFEWKSDRDLVRNIFVYDGINGRELPGHIAQSLGHDVRMCVNLMACKCDWDRKQRLSNSSYVNLYPVECGGSETLGAVADVILGIKRPEIDYNRLVISPEKILEKGERFNLR
ncbi:response regulator [Candidatus Woesearchaeota archaeon]|nr:response regulator [Candidatus Woesearchaeota archaeon]